MPKIARTMTQNDTITLTPLQLEFISYMKSNSHLTKVQADKLNSLIARDSKPTQAPSKSNSSLITFEGIRQKHQPQATADFYALFGVPSGLKFLTHDFDPDSEMTMEKLLMQVQQIIAKHKNSCPPSTYLLLNYFIGGSNNADNLGGEQLVEHKWLDYQGQEHTMNWQMMMPWGHLHPGLHPVNSPEYNPEIQIFRNTVRLERPHLQNLIQSLLNDPVLKTLDVHMDAVDKADFYTNVFYLRQILLRVLKDIAQRDDRAKVSISYHRSALQAYRLCQIRVTHEGSVANEFNDVRTKLQKSGGAMFGLMKCCQSYCDWTVEAAFEDGGRRWRILDSTQQPEVENLSDQEVSGFSHIFTFYKKV
jgi:hypothetical protein